MQLPVKPAVTLATVVLIAVLFASCSSPMPIGNAGPTASSEPLRGSATSHVTHTAPAPHRTHVVPHPSMTLSLEASPTLNEPQPGSTRRSDQDGMEQIFIPAGEFTMGSDNEDAKKSVEGGVASPEIPVHIVVLDGYWIDKYEVTNAQYRLCVDDGSCPPPPLPLSFTGFEYFANPDYADYPVIYVDFFMARDYCRWAGRRLPTEAEWAKAARGTDARRYTWGIEPVTGERANFCDINCPKTHADASHNDGYAETAPVGSYPAGASPYGVLDMAGNVWEWTSTIPMDYPYDPGDGREEPEMRPRDEVVFGDGPQRVWRGGTWANGTWWLRASIRYHSVPGYYHNSLGFRCAASQ